MNWEARISAARENGFFTDEDRHLSLDWKTCMIGEHVGVTQSLLDDLALRFGRDFCNAVHANDVERAAQIRVDALRINFCKQCSAIIDWQGDDFCSNCKG